MMRSTNSALRPDIDTPRSLHMTFSETASKDMSPVLSFVGGTFSGAVGHELLLLLKCISIRACAILDAASFLFLD